MPLWLPRGAAGVTDIAFPIILVPLLWAVPFFYACLEENLVRGGRGHRAARRSSQAGDRRRAGG